VTTAAPTAALDSALAGGAVAASTPPVPRHVVGQVLWMGDSVAADLAPALTAAFGAAGVSVIDGAGDGLRFTPGGDVDPVALYGARFDAAPFDVAPFDTVVLQLSYWDAPAELEQLRASFGWFLDQMTMRGAQLVVLTPPPVRADLADPRMQRQLDVMSELVERGEGRVTLVDTSPAWGTEMFVDIDADLAPDRKPDGVHVCPQGAARLAAWLVADLAARFDGIAVAPADTWVAGEWTSGSRYDTPTGSCVALG